MSMSLSRSSRQSITTVDDNAIEVVDEDSEEDRAKKISNLIEEEIKVSLLKWRLHHLIDLWVE